MVRRRQHSHSLVSFFFFFFDRPLGIATSDSTTLRLLRRRSLSPRDHFQRTGGTGRRTHCSETHCAYPTCCTAAEIAVIVFFYPP
uniref:Putative secreted protein n=1 Tax=Ixodes ricinus TaxID=34613 RepID=A0A6B0U7E2_IXORI